LIEEDGAKVLAEALKELKLITFLDIRKILVAQIYQS
jgi:hypothetical protein